jgi:hypothetical protein
MKIMFARPKKNITTSIRLSIASKESAMMMTFFRDHRSTNTPATGVIKMKLPKAKKADNPKKKALPVWTVIHHVRLKLTTLVPANEASWPAQKTR